MRTAWRDGGVDKAVTAPVSLIVSAFAPDRRRAARADAAAAHRCGDTVLLLVDLGNGRNRLGGSALAQVYGQLGNVAPDVDDPARARGILRAVQTLHRAGHAARVSRPLATAACSRRLPRWRSPRAAASTIDFDGARRRSARRRCSTKSSAPCCRCARPTGASCAPRSSAARARGCTCDRRARRPTREMRIAAVRRRRCSTSVAHRPASRLVGDDACACSGCATTRRCADEEYDAHRRRRAIRASRRRLTSTRARTSPRPTSRRARGPRSRSCASRASTARSRWRRRSTAPASTRSTCT